MFYLYGSISILLIFILLLAIRPDLWRQGLIPAFLFIPYGPISEQVFFQDYWTPHPVLPQFVLFNRAFLTEDLIYAFGMVGIMSIAYDFVLRRRPVERVHRPQIILAVAISLVSLLLFVWLPPYLPLNSILFSAAIGFVSGLLLIVIRRDLLRVALVNSLICVLGAFVFYFIILSLPGAVTYLSTVWHLPLDRAALWILGVPIPLTELLWAFAMAFYFGIIYKFAAGSGYQMMRG